MGIYDTTTPNNGKLLLRNYDAGLMGSLGCVVKDTDLDKGDKAYFWKVAGIDKEMQVIWGNSEQAFNKKIWPSICVKRTIEKAMQKDHPGHIQFRGDIVNLTRAITPRAVPYFINYEFIIQARYKFEADTAMLAFLHRFPPFGSIRVTDSAGDIRDYSTETEDPSDLDEVIDINTKMNGTSTILRVHGELDISDEIAGSGARVVGPDMSYVQLHVHRIP